MGKTYSSREVIQILKADGWYHYDTQGDHYQFKHPVKKGKVTVPHPNKELGKYVIQSIKKQAGLDF